ncbi:TKL family protein kinase [Histomonas meleagridis]|uniref:TKL family protein kinase n=1 Tax=Histomonas meleagridis TaxID=135588 RepID=UPI0035594572|nr:TKL family protein kinase [Histomonas meleagridis]KAH0804472.1 TKL family protein kinase [Histomonas meleagridis]
MNSGGAVNIDDFSFLKELGRGGCGEVWLGVHKPTGTQVAIKKLFVDPQIPVVFEHYRREVEILAKCKFPCVLHLFGYTLNQPLCIITPYITGGSLFDHLVKRSVYPPLDGTQKTIIAMGITYAMMRLHDLNIIHRDLKSMNVLLDENLLPVVCDFGISKVVGESPTQMTVSIGTPHWMAPEQFKSNDYDGKVDVYSFAMLLYEMLTEKLPFTGKNFHQVAYAVVEKGERPHLPRHGNSSISSLIKTCWNQNPKKRPTFREIFYLFLEGKVKWDGTNHKSVKKFSYCLMEADKEYRGLTKSK